MITIRDLLTILDAKVLCGEEQLDEEVRTACGSDLMSERAGHCGSEHPAYQLYDLRPFVSGRHPRHRRAHRREMIDEREKDHGRAFIQRQLRCAGLSL